MGISSLAKAYIKSGADFGLHQALLLVVAGMVYPLVRATRIDSCRACKPNSVCRRSGTTVIPLGRALLRGSSDLPGSCDAPSRHVHPPKQMLLPYLVLLRVGFSLPPSLLTARCALTAPFHPYLAVRRGGMFSVALSVNDA